MPPPEDRVSLCFPPSQMDHFTSRDLLDDTHNNAIFGECFCLPKR